MTHRKTVLHIISGLGDAGAEGALYRLVTHDPDHRHVVVSLADEGKYGPMLHQAGIELHCLRLTPARLVGQMRRLVSLIGSLSPDAIQCWMYEADVFGGIAARLSGVRNVHWSIRFSSVDMRRIPFAMRWSIRAAIPLTRIIPRTIISCSTKASAEHVRLGYPDDRFRLVHNGYDLDRTRFSQEGRDRIRADIGVDGGTVVIGMVARFDPQKDYATFLAALGRLSNTHDFHILLVGRDVDTSADCEGLVKEHGLTDRVTRLGSRGDVPDILSAMDIHVLASRFGEGFPNVVAEAMACGAASISTDSGDATYILEDCGFLVPMENIWALTRAIEAQLLLLPASDEGRNRMREANHQHIAARFSVRRMIERFHAVWSEEIPR